MYATLTEVQKIGHLTLLADARTNFVVTALTGFSSIPVGGGTYMIQNVYHMTVCPV